MNFLIAGLLLVVGAVLYKKSSKNNVRLKCTRCRSYQVKEGALRESGYGRDKAL